VAALRALFRPVLPQNQQGRKPEHWWNRTIPSPKFAGAVEEAFDGALIQVGVLVACEFDIQAVHWWCNGEKGSTRF
jgi:hypothetical protein